MFGEVSVPCLSLIAGEVSQPRHFPSYNMFGEVSVPRHRPNAYMFGEVSVPRHFPIPVLSFAPHFHSEPDNRFPEPPSLGQQAHRM